MKFTLHDFMKGAIVRMAMCTRADGKGYTVKRDTYLPGVEYTTEDPVMIDFITGKIGDVREKMIATPELKAELESAAVNYEKLRCGTCSISKLKYAFNPFKILED